MRSKREAREKAVRFDSSTVYCAKHLYTLDNEMCSTCAKRGWRDVRAPADLISESLTWKNNPQTVRAPTVTAVGADLGS